MLQTIRDRAHGWIAWTIVILISVPFALWGISSYLDVGSAPVAADVNGREITEAELDRRVQTARIQLREQLGAAYDPAQFDDQRLRREVLDDMIRETVLTDAAGRMGLRVSDQELRAAILAEPAFQRDGRFDNASYEQVLKYQGQSPGSFEAQLRQRIVGSQMARAVAGSELVTKAEREQYQRLSGQQREVAWLRLPLDRFQGQEPIEDQAISAYYEANAARFLVPEQVKLDYLVLDVAGLAAKNAVSEDEMRRTYDKDQARFGQPERRRVRHILLTVPPDTEESAAQAVLAEAQAVRQRIQDGEAFDVVAKAVSKDPGSASQGGSLGEIERGIMDPGFEQSAFTLDVGALSEPVRSRFGYHLIQVEAITPATVKPFDEVREQLRAEVAKQQAESTFYDLGERLANVVYESSDSLEPAAQELGLEIKHSDWVGRKGGEGLLGHPKVTGAAFSEEVLVEGRNSELIEPEKEVLQAVVLRVADHREASTRSLDEVRDEIIAELRKERARQAAAAAATVAADKLRGGAAWADVAGADKVEEPGLVGRNDAKLPAPVRTAAFTLVMPAGGGAVVATTTLDNGDAAILRVTKVEDGKVDATPGNSVDPGRLGQLLGRQAFDALLKDMETRAKIERKAVPTRDEG
ncbi:MAG TPA: SurA N-terminal domain-containing protein [Lamprocystis sp. (in: g-proteobacteria)]|nr:SurA N-terminal domain-containing protein [Lamprocystis sp. (in: g-proteobacteria)]